MLIMVDIAAGAAFLAAFRGVEARLLDEKQMGLVLPFSFVRRERVSHVFLNDDATCVTTGGVDAKRKD